MGPLPARVHCDDRDRAISRRLLRFDMAITSGRSTSPAVPPPTPLIAAGTPEEEEEEE